MLTKISANTQVGSFPPVVRTEDIGARCSDTRALSLSPKSSGYSTALLASSKLSQPK